MKKEELKEGSSLDELLRAVEEDLSELTKRSLLGLMALTE